MNGKALEGKWFGIVLTFVLAVSSASGAVTLVVTNNANAGPGTLQQALEDALTNTPPVRITFNIPGSLPQVIFVTNALTPLLSGVSVDASTQPGYAGSPVVHIQYAGPTGTFASGLMLLGDNLLRGVKVSGFEQYGVHLTESVDTNGYPTLASNVVIEGCWIVSNRNSGIYAFKSVNLRVGGQAASNRNVISGNRYYGIELTGGSGATIAGNHIGLSPTNSTQAWSNGTYGIFADQCPNLIVSGVAAARQVIAGNTLANISLQNGSDNARIHGNFIGVDATGGAAPATSTTYGIYISSAHGARIGGTNASERNIIGGHAGAGIRLDGASHTNIVILGNYIGTTDEGTLRLRNRVGISVGAVQGVVIGGNDAGAWNLISGNGTGISLVGSNHVVQGNLIGLSATGGNLSNETSGIECSGNNITIGGTSSVPNTICYNGHHGIYLAFASGCTIQGNHIGTDFIGAKRGNGQDGIRLTGAVGTRIGGSADGARNVISGNNNNGIWIDDGSLGNVVEGNYIGISPAGSMTVSNGSNGIRISSATNNLIGGTNAASRNVIAGNGGSGDSGVSLDDGATSNRIFSNYIGLDASGTFALTNGYGVRDDAIDTVIGAPGSGNVISGNRFGGLLIRGERTVIQGNVIGLSANGTTAIPNGTPVGNEAGVELNQCVGARIGGSQPGEGNVIAGNSYYEVELYRAVSNTLQGNRIGFDATGMATYSNNEQAISLQDSPHNQIGGAASGARNFIFSPGYGVYLTGSNSHHNAIQGNWFNLNAVGDMASRTSSAFVALGIVNAPSNIIGGVGATGNVFFSTGHYIQLHGSNCIGNVVRGNYLGVGPDGYSPRRYTTNLSVNVGTGIDLRYASRTTIGGTNAGEGNIIANVSYGVAILGTNATRNAILGNAIYATRLNNLPNPGIDLAASPTSLDGPTANDPSPDADSGANTMQNFPVITNAIALGGATRVQGYLASAPSKPYRIEFFRSDTNNAEARYFLGAGSVTTAANGTGAFSVVLGGFAATSRWITATATDTNNNTSEFFFPPVRPTLAADTDGDRMPDFWESQYGLNPAVSNGPVDDADNDHVPDVTEFFAGTIPNNANSYLAVDDLTIDATSLVTFLSSPYRNYDVEATSSPTNNAVWTRAYTNALGNGLALTVPVAGTETARFFRVAAFPPL